MTSRSASDWLDALQAQGRYHFTMADAVAGLNTSGAATRATLARLQRRGRIASPYRGFYLILPPEYRALGCLPPEHFIDQLMHHLSETYYVGLLSAAAYHGAAHQRPQRLQVVVARSRKPVTCGSIYVAFITRKDMAQTPTVQRNTPRGYLRVSTAEATALELIGYADRCGGLDNVATVLAELGPKMDVSALVAAAHLCPIAWVQRLGWLLEQVEHPEPADALLQVISGNAHSYAPLVRAAPVGGFARDLRWKLILNAEVEPDL